MVKVKICGITNLDDAKEALAAGADALGFIFADSPRKIAPARAQKIIEALGPWAVTVGVFVDEKPERMKKVAQSCRLSAIQLHGNESFSVAAALKGFKVIKAVRAATGIDKNFFTRYPADAFLFDTAVKGRFGGTGLTFDWSILNHHRPAKPVILSGGLNARNVGEAVRLARPYAVDVSSGVESKPGKKDRKLMRAFIKNAKKF